MGGSEWNDLTVLWLYSGCTPAVLRLYSVCPGTLPMRSNNLIWMRLSQNALVAGCACCRMRLSQDALVAGCACRAGVRFVEIVTIGYYRSHAVITARGHSCGGLFMVYIHDKEMSKYSKNFGAHWGTHLKIKSFDSKLPLSGASDKNG